jgi:hypothetical protein
MPVSSYLLTPPRSLEQVIADLGRDQSDSSNLHNDNSDQNDNSNNAPDAEQDTEANSASAP